MKGFMGVENMGELGIEEGVGKCRKDEGYSRDGINEIREEMNQLGKKGMVGRRRVV